MSVRTHNMTYIVFWILVALHECNNNVMYEVAHGEDASECSEVRSECEFSSPVRDIYTPSYTLHKHKDEQVQHAQCT